MTALLPFELCISTVCLLTNLPVCLQTGPYDSRHLNYESTGEPFPVLPTVRSEAHRELIIDEAKRADVYEEAKLEYEKVPEWRPEY